jgi:hypothetical protein
MDKVIGIKNLKYCDWMSEETNCFTATITVNGKDFCTAQDEGHGGCISFHSLEGNDYKSIVELDLWCKNNLPKWTSEYIPNSDMDTDLEIVVGDLVNKELIAMGKVRSLNG